MATNEKKLTMEDIAKICGVARSTVHAVFTNKPWVTEKTRNKVMDVVQKLNYSPCPIAKTLASGLSGLVGVVIRDLTNPFYDQFLERVEDLLKDYVIVYFNTRHDPRREARAVETLMGYRADGLIIAPARPELGTTHLTNWVRQGRALVSMDRLTGTDSNFVDLNDRHIGYMAAEHLFSHGHRRVCFFAGPRQREHHDDERVVGFKMCMLDYGIDPYDCDTIRVGLGWENGYRAASKLLAHNRDAFTAIICGNDYVAGGVYKAAHGHGVRIPDDLSVIGCDDIDLASVLGPSLTTINLNVRDIGEKVALTLLEQIRGGEDFKCVSIPVSPVLVERESVKSLSRIAPRQARARGY